MSEALEELEDAVYEALRQHANPIRTWRGGPTSDLVWKCTGDDCDWMHDRASDGGYWHRAHQSWHVAAEVRAWLARLAGDAGLAGAWAAAEEIQDDTYDLAKAALGGFLLAAGVGTTSKGDA